MARVLSPADEVRLSLAIERGDRRAREEMITANLRLVCLLARRYRGLRVPFEDLVQEGTVGLVRAVDRFDHRCGAKFSTFAVWWIRRAMTDAVQGERTIRIPPRAARALAAVERAEQELRRQLPGPPSTEAIAARTGLTVRAVGTMREAARVTASLDAVHEEGAALVDLLPDQDPEDPWRRLDERETRREVWAMLRGHAATASRGLGATLRHRWRRTDARRDRSSAGCERGAKPPARTAGAPLAT